MTSSLKQYLLRDLWTRDNRASSRHQIIDLHEPYLFLMSCQPPAANKVASTPYRDCKRRARKRVPDLEFLQHSDHVPSMTLSAKKDLEACHLPVAARHADKGKQAGQCSYYTHFPVGSLLDTEGHGLLPQVGGADDGLSLDLNLDRPGCNLGGTIRSGRDLCQTRRKTERQRRSR